ncbi:MAG: hypothetical protein IJM43_08090 [Bacteroidaceae bacterium]|nr:hypothetical protein [Bacteroidaceae bacterium]
MKAIPGNIDLTENRDFGSRDASIFARSRSVILENDNSSLPMALDDYARLEAFTFIFGKREHQNEHDLVFSPIYFDDLHACFCPRCGREHKIPWEDHYRYGLCKNCKESTANIPWNEAMDNISERDNTMDIFNMR